MQKISSLPLSVLTILVAIAGSAPVLGAAQVVSQSVTESSAADLSLLPPAQPTAPSEGCAALASSLLQGPGQRITGLADGSWRLGPAAAVGADFAGCADSAIDWNRAAGEPIDLRVARQFRRSGIQGSTALRVTADVAGFAGVPGTAILSAAFLAIGKLDDRRRMYDAGLHAGESLAVAAGLSLIGKVAAGRARPFRSPESPGDFDFGRGLEGDDYQSFPSFHTAAAFATGTIMVAEANRSGLDAAAWVAPAAYATAVLSGISRMYQDQHWLTDVLAGAVVGTASGLLVDRIAH